MIDADISVLRLTPNDWRTERELRLAALFDAPSAFGSRLVDAEAFTEPDWRQRLSSQVRFAAWVGGIAVGTVGVAVDGEAYQAGTAVLVGMWVAPDARGRGVADQLVEAVIAEGRRDGLTAICLSVTHGNVVAERLYARHGFTRTGTDFEGDGDTFDRVRPIEP